MKNFVLPAIVILIFAFRAAPPCGAQSRNAEIKRIDSYCKTVDRFVKKHKRPSLIFADVSGDGRNRPRWRRFASEKALDAAETFAVAYVWRKGGRIIAVSFSLSSPSGDWAHYVYQYFRADGTLAKAASQLNTFYGSMTVLRDFYFDRRGRLLRKTTRYRDLETQRPKKTAAPDFPDDEVRIYKTTARLPFAGLLR